jgi:TolB-like protein/Tfp pilus assembly protein PilF/rhodanese-related sulfurtransferase
LVHQEKQLAHERIRDSFQRFSNVIEKYHGEVLELRGDALLASFERGSDAVSAALAFQADHSYQISRLQDELRPLVRVGISIGEVVIADNTVTGTGVVQAQRVEQLADPGCVCITGPIHESLSKRMSFEFLNLGEKELKGFDHVVHVYRVELISTDSIPPPTETVRPNAHSRKRGVMLAIAAVLLVVVGATAFWFQSQKPKVEAASVERMAFPLPDRPSIAVLPFNNMSDDPQQEYFADGMTEDLITDLSKLSELFVVARNTVFTYKGKAVKVREVAEDLGVRYVLEGSVRRSGDKVRINAQLIDALSGGHVWAERYDGILDDVFALQDKVTRGIVGQLAINLSIEEKATIASVESADSKAYDLFLKGWGFYRSGAHKDYSRAIELFKKAIAIDPGFSRAHAALAAAYWDILEKGWWQQSLDMPYYSAFELARVALQRSRENPTVLTHQIAAEWEAYYSRGSRLALKEAEQALKLDPNHPASHMALAVALMKDKRLEEAEKATRNAMRLDPHYPARYLVRLAQIQFLLENYANAVESLEEAVSKDPNYRWAHTYLAAAYGQLNKPEQARKSLERADLLRAEAGFGPITQVTTAGFNFRWRWHGNRTALKEGLRKAGALKGGEWLELIIEDGASQKVKGATIIDAIQAKALHERGVVFVDIQSNWFAYRIPGAHFLEWFGMEGWMFNEVSLGKLVDYKNEVVIYPSQSGGGNTGRVSAACALAVSRGFTNVYCYPGGIDEWKDAGYPVDNSKK